MEVECLERGYKPDMGTIGAKVPQFWVDEIKGIAEEQGCRTVSDFLRPWLWYIIKLYRPKMRVRIVDEGLTGEGDTRDGAGPQVRESIINDVRKLINAFDERARREEGKKQ
jgi:hypothetical protein